MQRSAAQAYRLQTVIVLGDYLCIAFIFGDGDAWQDPARVAVGHVEQPFVHGHIADYAGARTLAARIQPAVALKVKHGSLRNVKAREVSMTAFHPVQFL